jgi:MFS family permease
MVNQRLQPNPKAEPKFFYGYIVVLSSLIIMVALWGAYSVYGVFFNPLISEFNWTRAATSGAFSLATVLSGVLGVVVGEITDRFGPRILMTVACLLFGLGHLLMWQVSSLWQLYLYYGVIVGVGMSGSWVPPLSTVARWFSKRRSLMTGIVIAGLSVGRIIGPPVISGLIAVYDWRLTYVILGGTVLVLTVIASQFLKRDPGQMGLLPYGADKVEPGTKVPEVSGFSLVEAVCTWQFWEVFAMVFCHRARNIGYKCRRHYINQQRPGYSR